MEECNDGQYQDFKSKDGGYIRKNFFGRYPRPLLSSPTGQTRKFGRSHAAVTIRARFMRPTLLLLRTAISPLSFSPKPSRATAWARLAKVR